MLSIARKKTIVEKNPQSVNILERLLKGGINYIPLPHRVGCCCSECSTKQKEDGLRLESKAVTLVTLGKLTGHFETFWNDRPILTKFLTETFFIARTNQHGPCRPFRKRSMKILKLILRLSRFRLDVNQARGSEALLILTETDPIMKSFQLAYDFQKLSLVEIEFREEYLDLGIH